MEKLNRKGNALLSLSIIFILSGSILDISDIFLKTTLNTWAEAHCTLVDLQFIGFALLCFTICDYSKLKIKSFIFMLLLWRVLVFVLNIAVPEPQALSIIPLYVIYVIFLFRIVRLKNWPPVFLDRKQLGFVEHTSQSFNVLIPINTFRGLLQILFTRASPKYETRLLVSNGFIYSVQRNRFIRHQHDQKIVEDLMEKAGARIKLLGHLSESDLLKHDMRLGKRAITGIRDCRRLEI